MRNEENRLFQNVLRKNAELVSGDVTPWFNFGNRWKSDCSQDPWSKSVVIGVGRAWELSEPGATEDDAFCQAAV